MACIHPNCKKSLRRGRSTFKFPDDIERRKKWFEHCGLTSSPTIKKPRLCEYHFDKSQFSTLPHARYVILLKSAVPTITPQRKPKKIRNEHSYACSNSSTYEADDAYSRICKEHNYNTNQHELPTPTRSRKRFCLGKAANLDPPAKKTRSNESTASSSSSSLLADNRQSSPTSENSILHVAAHCEIPADYCTTSQDLHNRCKKRNNTALLVCKLQLEKKKLKKTVRELRGKLFRANKKIANQALKLRKLFSSDQIATLRRPAKRCSTLSDETLKNSLEVLFACGSSGYNFLRKKEYPIPSLRSIRQHIQHVKIDSGILHEVFQWMKVKADDMNKQERMCLLSLDEMSLKQAKEFDVRTGTLEGEANFPNHSGPATHALVFQLCGLSTRWKQVVAYYFTPNSVKGAEIKPVIIEIITKAAEAGLDVVAVTSDMASCNMAMWSSFGIHVGKNREPQNKIPHPVNPNKYLYFLADAPHLLKNLKQALINGHNIKLPQSVVHSHSLPSDIVTVEHLKILNNHQRHSEVKLSHKINDDLLEPDKFNKMKVKYATAIFSNTNAAALEYLVKVSGQQGEILTTAWFLATINKWFDLISSRRKVQYVESIQNKFCVG